MSAIEEEVRGPVCEGREGGGGVEEGGVEEEGGGQCV